MKMQKIDQLIAYAVFLLVALMAVVISFGYVKDARTFPLLVGLVTSLLLILQILADFFPNVKALKFIKPINFRNRPSATRSVEKKENNETKKEEEVAVPWTKVFVLFGWLIGFVIMTKYIIYSIGAPIFIFLITHYLSKESLKISIFLALGTGLFLYLIFGLILGR